MQTTSEAKVPYLESAVKGVSPDTHPRERLNESPSQTPVRQFRLIASATAFQKATRFLTEVASQKSLADDHIRCKFKPPADGAIHYHLFPIK